ncbi:MAG: uracil-DNA glycosylase [Bacteroidales bacterium]|nr:uracil-DNA glycosylase [Bacteroidales bacterium]MBO7345978.1 uracil-DNA glycosylase [Bacteroidales bacterium]
MDPKIEQSWKEQILFAFQTESFFALKQFLIEEKKKSIVFPPNQLIFNAFNLTPFDKVKVVLLGQDPYHNVGQAHGLCFSVPDGVAHPKSLVNIFKELHDDIGCPIPKSGNLEKWAKQGVLLLNATLTVRAHEAGSHQKKGWEEFTNAVIKTISDKKEGVVFLLWGNYAQEKIPLIDQNKHHILTTVHPSPLSASRGFFGCRHFSKTNQILQTEGKEPIDWDLTK